MRVQLIEMEMAQLHITFDYDLLSFWPHALIWNYAGLLFMGRLGTHLKKFDIIQQFPFSYRNLKISGAQWRSFLSRSRCVKERWCTTSLLPCIGKATPSHCDKFDEWMLYSSITGLLFSTWTASVPHWISTVYPKKYAHGFVVLCFVVVMQSFIINSREVFIHIHQGCFPGTGAIVRLPQCQWSKPGGYGEISQCITTTKHSKAESVCIFLGIYCISSHTMIYPRWDCIPPL